MAVTVAAEVMADPSDDGTAHPHRIEIARYLLSRGLDAATGMVDRGEAHAVEHESSSKAEDAAKIDARFKQMWRAADVQIRSSCMCQPGVGLTAAVP